MTFQRVREAWRDFENFKSQLRDYPIELLDKISVMIYDEKVRRAAEENLPPMTYIEWGMADENGQQSKILAIKAYRIRVGCSLLAAIQKWKQTDEEVQKMGKDLFDGA